MTRKKFIPDDDYDQYLSFWKDISWNKFIKDVFEVYFYWDIGYGISRKLQYQQKREVG